MKKAMGILLTSLCVGGSGIAQPAMIGPEEKKFILAMETNLQILDTASIGGHICCPGQFF